MSHFYIRPVNALLAGASFLRGSVSGYASAFGMPPAISFELTNHCNLHCPECLSGSGLMKRDRGFMNIDLYTKVIDELKPYLYYVCLYFQGEPMLHPQFFAFLTAAADVKKILSTNGHFLTAENAERLVEGNLWKIIVSLDGTNKETYSKYRVGGNFEKVAEGIKLVADARRRARSNMKFEIQFLVNRHNEHQIPDAKRLAGEADAKLSLKSMQILNHPDAGYWLPSMAAYSRYRKEKNSFVSKNSMPDRCARLWLNPVVTWDGKVVPCCYDKDADHIMGDLNCDSFRTIWKGEAYSSFRKQVHSSRNKIHICRNCTSGLRAVKY